MVLRLALIGSREMLALIGSREMLAKASGVYGCVWVKEHTQVCVCV